MRPATVRQENQAPAAEVGALEQRTQDRTRLLEVLDERMRFEALLVELSAAFVNLAADAIDPQIEHSLRRLVEFLGIDRSGFGELSEDRKRILVTHVYVVPGFPPFPWAILDDQFPWFAEKIRQGEVLRFTQLPDDAPPEAVTEREYCIRVGLKSNLTIPLKVGGTVLGVITFGSFRVYRAWPDDLVQRLRLVGEIFANALARKRADQALRQSEQRYRELLETAHAVPWEADAFTFQVRYVGPQVGRLLGYPVEEWYRPGFWAAHLHPGDRERVLRATADAVRRGADHELEYRMVSAGGNEVWIHDLVTVPRADGGPPALRGVMIDVTARKSAEEEAQRLRDQLARVARVTTMGELAAAIAHEINQPLCAIVSNAQAAQRLLAGAAADLGEVREALQDIVADGRRASMVIGRIRTLLQKRPPEHAPLDLNEATREVVALVQHQLARQGITLSLDLAADLPPVVGDRVQLQQVVLNLMVNAVEALGHVTAGPRELSLRSARTDRERVAVSVRDSGPGIAPGQVERVFDAFFTTKPGGMGIGLAISRSILETHGGRIWADPDAGGGAAFHFTLPVAQEPPP
jgi:PAS domain S-box-containing protein